MTKHVTEDGITWTTVRGTFTVDVIADNVDDALYHALLKFPDVTGDECTFDVVDTETCRHLFEFDGEQCSFRDAHLDGVAILHCPFCGEKL